jgi:phosphopantetheinyl transferase
MIQVFVLPYEWVMQHVSTDRIQNILPEVDISKANRFVHQTDQDRYLAARLFLFGLLKQKEIINSDSLNLSYNTFGKPFLAGIDVHFNWSHSGDLIALILSSQDCGIDIEMHTGKVLYDYQSLCTELELNWMIQKSREEGISELISFLDLWAAKESVVKAKGTGLYTDPRHIEIRFEDKSNERWVCYHESEFFGSANHITWNDKKYSLAYCTTQKEKIYPIFDIDIVKNVLIYIQK